MHDNSLNRLSLFTMSGVRGGRENSVGKIHVGKWARDPWVLGNPLLGTGLLHSEKLVEFTFPQESSLHLAN